MNCINPIRIATPESRWLRKCRKENRSFEYYFSHANARRNLLLDPVPLVNDAYEYYDVHPDVRYQVVPCGKCDNCIKRKVNDFFVRNYFEYVDCLAHHGKVFFITLTFADELLPRLPDGTPCFDSEYVKKFLKRLRVFFERKLKYYGKFLYSIVSEYGGEFGRPHLHGLLFCYDFKYTTTQMLQAVAQSWTKLDVRKDWYANDDLSLFDVQRVDVQLIDSSKCIRYVSKYIGKQIGCDEFDRRHIDSRFKRRHFSSIGLGLSMYKYIDFNQFKDGFITVEGFKYCVPQYFSLKLKREFYCYADNGTIIYQPTDFARDSVRKFTLDRLQEYKNLSLLNAGFPKCPLSLYDSNNLALLEDWLSRYGGFEFSHDFSGNDRCRFMEISFLVNDINEFFEAVDAWYRPKYLASALLYRKHQDDYYKKKIGLKC